MNNIIFPRPFAFAIDDVGWMEGGSIGSISKGNATGPYRAGVKRHFDINDYKSIVEVGKNVGARVQSLFILSEWDKENILAQYPTTTYQRSNWKNTFGDPAETDSIARYVTSEAAYIELGLHGTGHEYWGEGERQYRAEWYNLEDRRPWPEEIMRGHLEACHRILEQYGLTTTNGHSFPESFVPCAYSYYWNPGGPYSLGKLLSERGVKFANTDFSQIPELSPPSGVNAGGFDHGVHVINRMQFGNDWFELATLPKVPIYLQYTDVIESHWPNWLAQDNFLQEAVTARWVEYYRQVQRTNDRYIAKNTEQLHSQWLYNKYTRIVELGPGHLEIDNSSMPIEAYINRTLGNMVLKIPLENGQHLSGASINDKPVPAFFEDEGFGFLYLPPLERQKYDLKFRIDDTDGVMPHVVNEGTCNVYGIEETEEGIRITLRQYGAESLKVNCEKPTGVYSDSDKMIVLKYTYYETVKRLEVQLRAADVQGVTASVFIRYRRDN